MAGLTVFLTGAGRGLGSELAELLLERGETVFAGVYSGGKVSGKSGGEAGSASESGAPARAVSVPIDISNDASVLDAARLISARTRHLDVIMNVAGILGDYTTTLPGALDYADMQRVFDVNAVGAVRVVNALFPLLLAGRTRLVVNVSSDAGSIARCLSDSWYAYRMSKAALNMASVLMHNRLRPLGGRVMVVHPGWMRTWMRGALDEAAPLSPHEAAAGVTAQMDRAVSGEPQFVQEMPAFVDGTGVPLPW